MWSSGNKINSDRNRGATLDRSRENKRTVVFDDKPMTDFEIEYTAIM